MGCLELSAERCPCLLAETAECPYCTLLRDETVCGCDWEGRCAFDRYQWRDRAADDRPAGTVVGVRPLNGATGLVIKATDQLAAAPAGTTVKLRLPLAGGPALGAIALRNYPAGLVYLLTFDPCPGDLILGRAVTPAITGNAFTGHETLAAATGRTIAILAAAPVTALLAPLVDGLRGRNNAVTFARPGDPLPADDAVVFAAGGENEIKRMATALPPSFRGQIVAWVIGG